MAWRVVRLAEQLEGAGVGALLFVNAFVERVGPVFEVGPAVGKRACVLQAELRDVRVVAKALRRDRAAHGDHLRVGVLVEVPLDTSPHRALLVFDAVAFVEDDDVGEDALERVGVAFAGQLLIREDALLACVLVKHGADEARVEAPVLRQLGEVFLDRLFVARRGGDDEQGALGLEHRRRQKTDGRVVKHHAVTNKAPRVRYGKVKHGSRSYRFNLADFLPKKIARCEPCVLARVVVPLAELLKSLVADMLPSRHRHESTRLFPVGCARSSRESGNPPAFPQALFRADFFELGPTNGDEVIVGVSLLGGHGGSDLEASLLLPKNEPNLLDEAECVGATETQTPSVESSCLASRFSMRFLRSDSKFLQKKLQVVYHLLGRQRDLKTSIHVGVSITSPEAVEEKRGLSF